MSDEFCRAVLSRLRLVCLDLPEAIGEWPGKKNAPVEDRRAC
jgi:hypothetical protein